MATNVIMPQLGESVVEGTISRWLVQVGDTVEQYSPIMEVSTDKVDTEVPAPVAGLVLKLYHPEGATLQAGTVIAAIGQAGEAVADQPARVDLHAAGETAQAEPAAEAAPAKPAGRDLGRISPVVARIAQEHNVDLSQVAGSGREGRITKQDVLAYVEARERGAVGAPVAAPCLCCGPDRGRTAPLGAARQRRPVQAHRRFAAIQRLSRARSGSGRSGSTSSCTRCRWRGRATGAPHPPAQADRRAHAGQPAHLAARDHGHGGRHERCGGASLGAQGRVCGQGGGADLHALLRPGRGGWAQGRAAGQRGLPRGWPAAQASLPHRHCNGRQRRAGGAGNPRRGRAQPAGAGAHGQRPGPARPRRPAQAGRDPGIDLHHHQPRHERQPLRHAHHQPAQRGYSRHGGDPEAAGGDQPRPSGGAQRRGLPGHPPHGLPQLHLRPPRAGRRGRRCVRGDGEAGVGGVEVGGGLNHGLDGLLDDTDGLAPGDLPAKSVQSFNPWQSVMQTRRRVVLYWHAGASYGLLACTRSASTTSWKRT